MLHSTIKDTYKYFSYYLIFQFADQPKLSKKALISKQGDNLICLTIMSLKNFCYTAKVPN